MTDIICPHDGKETPFEHCVKQRWSPAPVVGNDLWPQCRRCIAITGSAARPEFMFVEQPRKEPEPPPRKEEPVYVTPARLFVKMKPHEMFTGRKCGHTRRRDQFYDTDAGFCKPCRRVMDAQKKAQKQAELRAIAPLPKTFKETQSFEQWTGTVCGHSKLKKDFYASNSGTCIACYRKAYREGVRKKQEETKLKAEVAMEKPEVIEQMPVADLKPELPCYKPSLQSVEEVAETAIAQCEIHGPHNGTMIGGKRNASCPTCSEEKRLKAYRDMLKKKITLDFVSWPWLLTWVRDEAGKKGISPEGFIEQSLMLAVPEKELKRLILETGKL